MADYSWIAVFKAVADWITDYENHQSELIQILRDIGVDKGLEDELSDGNKVPLTEIDPFTFFATFMKYGTGKRAELFSRLLEHIGLAIPAPTGFDGVPSAQPLKVWLFPYFKERKSNMVPNLWKLFHQMRSGTIDAELFDSILRIPHTGFTKLTECLFYLSPEQHFPVDAQTKPWLTDNGGERPKENWGAYQALLNWLREHIDKPFYEISHEAWLSNQKKDFSAKLADLYLSDRYEGTRLATPYLIVFKINTIKELAFDPGNNSEKKKKITLLVNSAPPDTISSTVGIYDAEKRKNHHLAEYAPNLSSGNPVWAVEIKNIDQLTKLCDWYESDTDKELNTMQNNNKHESTYLPLNQILYGPPGTGKTYATTALAVKIADPEEYKRIEKLDNKIEKRTVIKALYENLVKEKRVSFTTFHQSYSYEDFIEGIRANASGDEGILRYEVEEGVFKEIASRADKAVCEGEAPGLASAPTIWKISIGRKQQQEMRQHYINAGEARIGWNLTGDLSLDYDDRSEEEQNYWDSLSDRNHNALTGFSDEMQVGDVLLCLKDSKTVQAVGVVTSDYYFDNTPLSGEKYGYAHSRKVDWLLTNIEFNILPVNDQKTMVQQTLYPLNRISWNDLSEELANQGFPLHVKNASSKIEKVKPNYVLIIDEINRGNIARIFGELITLLEPDKRKGGADARSIVLPYSKETFTIPSNLYVIGTMNTADKSLAQLDLALRRRFDFSEMMPDSRLLGDIEVHGVSIGQLLKIINSRIEVLLDRDHLIGHSYFFPLNNKSTDRQAMLATIFKNKIIPLLQEYFFSDWEKIGWVLNDIDKPWEHRFIQLKQEQSRLKELFSHKIASDLQDRRYQINNNAFETPASYQGIIIGAEK